MVCLEQLIAGNFTRSPNGRLGVAAALQDLVKNETVLIDSTPQPEFLAAHRHAHLVEMPDITGPTGAAAQPTRDRRTELDHPPTERLAGDFDSALERHLLHGSQAETEAEVQPDGMSDDLWRKPVALVVRGGAEHGAPLSTHDRQGNRRMVYVTAQFRTGPRVNERKYLAGSNPTDRLRDFCSRTTRSI